MAVFSLPTSPPLRPPVVDNTDMSGEDVAFGLAGAVGYTVGQNGDWMTVKGELAAKQSVQRELPNRPGALARKPDWGAGLVDQVFRNMNKRTLDKIVANVTRRLRANPRIARVVSVVGFNYDGLNGVAPIGTVPGTTVIRVEYVAAGEQRPTVIVFNPSTVTYR